MTPSLRDPRPAVVCIGELLVDFVPSGDGTFAPRAGGAPANVAAALSSLGRTAAMVSAVGDDWLGDVIRDALRGSGVETSALQIDEDRPTGIAIVAPAGARGADFVIHRDAAADAHLVLGETALDLIRGARCLHLSSLLTTSPAGVQVFEDATGARDKNRTFTSYDVNLRRSAWSSPRSMVESALRMIASADLVKVTEEELRLLSLHIDPRSAEGRIWLITDGAAGARLVTPRLEVRRDVTPSKVVDSTGAGDATFATLLDGVLDSPAAEDRGAWTAEEADGMLERAMRVGAHVVTQSGAMTDLSAFRVAGR